MGTSDFLTNIYNQVHNWWSTIGIALALALAQFFLDNETFTLRMVIVTLLGAGLKYLATHDDHVKTQAAVQAGVEQAVVDTQVAMAPPASQAVQNKVATDAQVAAEITANIVGPKDQNVQ